MGTVNHPEDLVSVVRDLERQVRELRRRSLGNAAISQGGLEVRTSEGAVIMRAGEFPWGSQTAHGVEFRRQNGGLQARFADTPGGNGYWALHDEAGNVICSEDTMSGQGLATPYLGAAWMPYSEVLSPPIATTSATFVITHRAHFPKQHPRVRVLLLCDSDADTTGEVILADGGSQIGGTVTVPLASNQYFWLDAEVAGSHMTMKYLDLQVRRTAGTGNVRVAPAWIGGVQS